MSELNPYDIKHIKLSTGEEVLCEIIEEDEYDLVIRRALKAFKRILTKRVHGTIRFEPT